MFCCGKPSPKSISATVKTTSTLAKSMSSIATKTLTLLEPCLEGTPGPENYKINNTEINPDDVKDNEMLLKLTVLSADPFQRNGMKVQKAGSPVTGFVCGEVLSSKNKKFAKGDLVGSSLPFATHQIIDPSKNPFGVWNLTKFLTPDTVEHGISFFGMPGSTAYGGLLDVLKPLEGETIFISAASGAVGSLVGLLAKKMFNCKVIGSAGGPEKCKVLMDLGYFDHAIDYKANPSFKELNNELKKAAPDGIDMYFENVGGVHFDVAMARLRTKGRVAVCGVISQYNLEKAIPNKLNLGAMIYSQQTIQGFTCAPYLSGQKLNFFEDIGKLYKEGAIKVPENTVFTGIESFPEAFQTLFSGAKMGKVVVKLP